MLWIKKLYTSTCAEGQKAKECRTLTPTIFVEGNPGPFFGGTMKHYKFPDLGELVIWNVVIIANMLGLHLA